MPAQGLFACIAAIMVLLALGCVLPALLGRRHRGPQPVDRDRAVELEVQRRRLAELDRELEAGTISVADHARSADLVRRQVLTQAATGARPGGEARGWRVAAALVSVALPLASAALYVRFGDPAVLGRAPDAVPAAAASAAGAAVASDPGAPSSEAALEAHVARAPEDARAWVLLGRARMAANRFPAAARAYERALALSPKVARDPAIWCELADAVGMAQGGVLAGRPAALVERALALDDAHPQALEMAGSARYEAGDYAGALRYWERLLAQLPAGSAEWRELSAAIRRARELGAS